MSGIAIPSDIYSAVAPVAKQYGVPDAVWETVAYVESGFNPRAVGDNGTSFGLFQLHQGGQLPQQYYSDPQATFDPALNARLAMPAIARGYQQAGAVATSSLAWWEKFGSISGHPGGSAGVDKANVAEAQRLLQSYPDFGKGSTSDPAVQLLNSTVTNDSDCCGDDFGCKVCKSFVMTFGAHPVICCPGVAASGAKAASDSALQAVFDALRPVAVKVGIFIVGLVLFIVAWWLLLKGRG